MEALEVAPSTYYSNKSRPPSKRSVSDALLLPVLLAIWIANYSVYGRRKLTEAAHRAGHDVGRDQVARLMALGNMRGARRDVKRFTTHADKAAIRAPDHLKRDFTATAPNMKWVCDIQCRRRHWMSYADTWTMPTFLSMGCGGAAFGAGWSA